MRLLVGKLDPSSLAALERLVADAEASPSNRNTAG
jgi:hypothetical protein